MLVFVAAAPMEFAGLVRVTRNLRRESLAVDWARGGELNGTEILMIANGAGGNRAGAAVDAVNRADAVVSTGFCGAVDPAMGIGDIFVASSVQGLPTRTPTCPRPCSGGALVSLDHVAQAAAEKQKLRAAGAAAVDMEAAGVLERAQRRNLPFFCVRSVTDLADETFANDFNAALREDGHFATMQILRSAIRRPAARLPELVRLRNRCAVAAARLGEFLADCRF